MNGRPVNDLSERELLLLLNERFEDHLESHARWASTMKWMIGMFVPIISAIVGALSSFVLNRGL